ncbi:MAG: autotransporter-associated beta strand repeat-containing protein [Kiritimatiellaeota bacterium]|nr:autotransporter-associated beta strand repeat-containing protein [Kiritimatiellota bacterium]
MKTSILSLRLMLAVVTLLALSPAAQGQIYRQFDGSAGNLWKTAANWSGDNLPDTTQECADFDGDNNGVGNLPFMKGNNVTVTIGQLRIKSPATVTSFSGMTDGNGMSTFTLSPSAYFGGVGLDMSQATVNFTFISGSADNARELVLKLGETQQWDVTGTSVDGNLVLGTSAYPYNDVNLQTFTLTANVGTGRLIDSTYATFRGTTGGIIKTGAGELKFGRANTYTGLTEVQGGTLTYAASNVIATGGVTVNGASAILDIKTFSDSVDTVTLQGGGQIKGTSGVLTSTGTFEMQSGSVSAILAGSGIALNKTTADTVTLTGVNTYSGATAIKAGTLSINSIANINSGDSALGNPAIGNGTIAMGSGATGATLQYTGGGHSSDRAISLDGTTGGATLDASGAGNAALTLTSTAAIAAGAGSKTLTLTGTSTGANTLAGIVQDNSGANTTALTKDGVGKWILSGVNTYTGGTTISGGTLQIGDGSTTGSLSASSTIINNGTLAFNRSNAIAQGTDFANAISGSGDVVQKGSGTLVLSSANTYTGATAINAGTLSINSVATGATAQSLGENASLSLGVAATSSGVLYYTGGVGTLDKDISVLGHGADTIQNAGSGLLTLSGTLAKNGTTLTLKGGNGITVSGAITGAGANSDLIVDGGVVTLTNANTYNGITTVSAGVLRLNSANALPGGIGTVGGTSALTFNGGGVGLGHGDFTRSLAAAGTVTGANFTGSGGWAAYGADRLVNLGGNGTPDLITWATANTGFNGQTLILGASSATHMVTLQNPIDLGTATRTVQVDDGVADIDATLSGNLSGAGGGALTKTGNGTLVLSGANTSSGATTVSGGTLHLTGSLAGYSGKTTVSNATAYFNHSGSYSGLITAENLGTVGGTGTVSMVNMKAGSLLSPGNSVGTLTLTSDLELNGARLLMELAGTSASDKLVVSGNMNMAGTNYLQLALTNMQPNRNSFYLLEGGPSTGFWPTGSDPNGDAFTLRDLLPNGQPSGFDGIPLTEGLEFYAQGGGTVSNQFRINYNLGGSDFNVVLTVIPEPTTLQLLMFLGTTFALRRKLRR